MGTVGQDVRYGLRLLARSPGFAGVVLLIIGVGIAANAALFNALDQVYMRPLAVKKPHELVSVQSRYRHGAWEFIVGEFGYPTYEAYGGRSDVFADLVAFTGAEDMDLRLGGERTRVQGAAVSGNYFSSLGVKPALGRLIGPEQGQSPTAYLPIAVISHRLWHRCFGGRSDVMGKQIVLDNQVLSVVGVAPAGFRGTVVGHPVEVFIPLGTAAQILGVEVQELDGLYLLGRLQPSVGRREAQAALQVLDAQGNPSRPGQPETKALVLEGRQGYVPRDAQVASYPMALFLGIAALVLMIACANVANLQLARAVTRQKEVAVRQALGAGRRRLVRQLLVESLLLAGVAGAFGLLLAAGLDRIVCTLLPRLISANTPTELQIHMTPGLHPRTLLFAVLVSLATGVAFGLTPALGTIRRDVVSALKESAGGVRRPASRWNPQSALVVAQISVAVVVTVCSGLCLRNLIGLRRIDPGYDTTQLVAVGPHLEGPPTFRPEIRRFMEGLQERVNGLPGVVSTSLSSNAPLNHSGWMRSAERIEGAETTPPDGQFDWSLGIVSPGHFRTLGQTLLRGRDFTAHDGLDAAQVMIVNEVLAKQFWPNQDPIGKHVLFKGEREAREIVGVVKTVKFRSLIEGSRAVAYVPFAQESKCMPYLLIRTAGNPRPLLRAIPKVAAELDALTSCDVCTVADQVSELLLPQRVLTGILNGFALVGLLLSALGIYAVMAYAVRQRTWEIGLRIALGAQGRDVLVPVLLRGALLLAAGLGLGLGLALTGTRLLANWLPQIRAWDYYFLYGIDTWDPPTYAAAALVIAAVALLACYLPARRAARIDPMVALRYE
jgi:predicted permease